MAPAHIAILGGGLTGLSSAFHLSRRFPNSLITLLDKETRLGGWARTKRIQVKGADGKEGIVVIEAGPRTLRPNAKSVLELINLLDLKSSLVTVSKSSPAARNRYLRIPNHAGLEKIPSSLLSMPFSSLGRTMLLGGMRDIFSRRNRPPISDESVDSFLARRFGEKIARTFGSAIIHGIYAADSRMLSLRAAFPSMWESEDRGSGSVSMGFLRPVRKTETNTNHHYELGDVMDLMRDVSVYSFKDGIGSLTDTLAREIRKKPNVRVYSGVGVTSLRLSSGSKGFEVTTVSNETLHPTHVVSALPLPRLHSLLPPTLALPHLKTNPYTSVTVVNLVFSAPSGSSLHPPGFGYLVPRPDSGYTAEDAGILGCVFDSSATASQDNVDGIVKLTVMLGGPYPISPAHVEISTILRNLSIHLGVSLPQPLAVRIHSNANCIPMLGVGHVERMKDLKQVLEQEPWSGRLEVVGAGVGGVSVGDCVEAGRGVGQNWA
ncbi:hypothetical protein SERLA73DRAFT_165460 [Serpula lacrymans var. lacrymans S7.3]|uniref:Protoporphyrinogen oxidase n=2 Tax=Serpula lacrymans var. lacrymans TaxID=341189 RepID=F8PKT7_SERL3|nr:uncharacterized protein SERLADRAFT_445600 [Serpula lacrymans var. lacrymans S7.9]EGO03896.1 hypothetical protein SERLA73DRAFT_165460 [Serpula lacrymans var. lacrymans S7.3]EGO29818.1 hypothetical protein SERLADRAFT_445600 [Serpula lacrymans var. lacrymans S7.9]